MARPQSIDHENLQLMDRLHTMSSEIANLKTSLNSRENLQEDLHRALEDCALLEISMRGDMQTQKIHREELEYDIDELQRRLELKNVKDAVADKLSTQDVDGWEQAVTEMRMELAEKTSQIDSYESALKSTVGRLEDVTDESHNRLNNAFEIARSLRALLDENSSKYSSLEMSFKLRELELTKAQDALTKANCLLSQTLGEREQRITQLEGMLDSKDNRMMTQQQLHDMELAMDLKNSRIQKLESEMKLMRMEHLNSSKSKVSIRNLSPPRIVVLERLQPSSQGGLLNCSEPAPLSNSKRDAYTAQPKDCLRKTVISDPEGGSDYSDVANARHRTIMAHIGALKYLKSEIQSTVEKIASSSNIDSLPDSSNDNAHFETYPRDGDVPQVSTTRGIVHIRKLSR